MKTFISFYFICVVLHLPLGNVCAQKKIFNQEINDKEQQHGYILSIAQDHEGYMWFGTYKEGLLQYDGSKISSITNNPQNSNSLANNYVESLFIDSLDIFWVGTFGSGLDRYDRAANTFTHFRHNAKDPASLSNDTVAAILQDRSGNLWVGTYGGLDLYNAKTNIFTHYANKADDAASLSSNHVRVIYEDKQGTLWVGCGGPFKSDKETPEQGGLNRLDKHSGKFIRYLHDPNNPNSIANNKVRAILEDSKGNFWVGTAGDGLHTLDRAKGLFTHYYYDSTHPEKLSRPPIYSDDNVSDFISFIHEDAKGCIWIGGFQEGINQYDPGTKKLTHHGYQMVHNKVVADTLSGFNDDYAWWAFSSRDGLLWISTSNGNVYTVNSNPKLVIPFYERKPHRTVYTFYEEETGTLWIGTDSGLIRQDITGKENIFFKNTADRNSLSSNNIASIQVDSEGKFWIATWGGGVNKFDPLTQTFTRYMHDAKRNSISGDYVDNLIFDHDNVLWIATETGLNKFDTKSGLFTVYKHNEKDSNSLRADGILPILEDNNDLWLGTYSGLDRFDKKNGKFKHYLLNNSIRSLFIDNEGILWAGAWEGVANGLYRYDKANDRFILFNANNGSTKIYKVSNIIADNENDLWVSAYDAIYKIDRNRNFVKIFGNEYGVHANRSGVAINYKTRDGKLLLGDQTGYYAFFPEKIIASSPSPIYITSFQVGDKEIVPGKGGALNEPLYKAREITLMYNQSSFSISFWTANFTRSGEKKYWYRLENYDTIWHDGASNKAYFFNLVPGNYVFHVKVMNADGVWNEKNLSVIISPPWWQTWWAITLLILGIVTIAWTFYYYRSRKLRKQNQILEGKVTNRTAQLQQSLEELKSTQSQLIQSEKMASLGELTAGIAHEIQNPLNFVNNFSEVNKELIAELKTEIKKGNIEEVNIIADDIENNEEKINFHGKRADAIVKGMLQHSRAGTGQKEPTDINALADEYLRLSYHGLRAKDKTFNAKLQTDFDESLSAGEAGVEKINIIAQDIGRVLVNLYNNAFYAVAEKKASASAAQPLQDYEPTVSVSTKRVKDKSGSNSVEIRIKDNGNGIPKKILDKIYQPFFTTKPAGQGTGLGLSLSYDIIKAHGGQLKVITKEGEGSEFIIELPVS